MQLAGRFCLMLHANCFRNVNACEALVKESAFLQKPCEVKMK